MENAKEIVKEKYGQIAENSHGVSNLSCCGPACCGDGVDYTVFSESYEKVDGYNSEADLGLGCGIPTEFAGIKKGDVVVDLGSGAGNDCFVARALAGETGRIIGVDMTGPMIEKARENVEKLGFRNVEFRLGDIEELPVESGTADVVISNCVLNLVPEKAKAFSEIYRILKPGWRLSVSDVVLRGDLPQKIREAAEMYAGCVSGAIEMKEYLGFISKAGLSNVLVQKEKMIVVPDDTLLNYLDQKELANYKESGSGIFSITVYAEKPG